MRRPIRTAAAVAIAAAAVAPAAVAAGAAGPAAAGLAPASGAPAVRQAGNSLPVSLTINSVSPAYLTPGKPVMVTGSVTNTSRAPIAGLTVRLRSSRTAISSRDGLQIYADGATSGADSPVSGAVTAIRGTLAPHATAPWSVRLRASQLGLTLFGVYPLAAEADNAAGAALVTSRTFLPFWPGRRALNPVRQHIGWIWPLIGQPQQTPCQGLLTNGLATSLGAGGRLSGLLAAGRPYAASAHLTWAIDPALLSSAEIMTRPYQFGATASCADPSKRPASAAAQRWLASLRSVPTGQPVFVTPYADVDVAALSRHGLDDDLARAFAVGRSTAGRILRRDFTAPAGAAAERGTARLAGLAWPAGGIASYGVLNSLAVRGISSVVLDSSTMPPSPSEQTYTPSAVTTTPSGVGPRMHVLLADDTLTQILGTANHGPAPPGTSFAVAQRFLAETAMIAAERPLLARSIVVAPPRQWNPPAGLASHLLADTVSAPWLRPVSLPRLADADPGLGQVPRKLLHVRNKGELSKGLLRKVRRLDRSAALLQAIRVQPDQALAAAIIAVESSEWRGGGARARQARIRLARISAYLSRQERSVVIIGPDRVTLGGLSGTLPVSISNGLRYPVRVRVQVTVPRGERITVKAPPPKLVESGADVTLKLHVRAATVGSTTIQLSLRTPEGAPLPGQPVALTVQATHFGTLALAIIGAALGVFAVTSARRAFTRGRGEQPGPDADGPAPDGADAPDRPDGAGRADNVVTDRADDKHPPEDPDEYASAPGRTDRR